MDLVSTPTMIRWEQICSALVLAGTAAVFTSTVASATTAPDSGDDASSTASAITVTGADGAPAADGEFPRTVTHAFGETTIEADPERVVSIGFTEHDTLLALGIVPVGLTEWYGDWERGVWPWALDELGEAEPTVLSIADGFQYERIAALEPDLIIGVNGGVDEESYARLAKIAPTVAQPDGVTAWFGEWDVLTSQIGAAVGRDDDTAALIATIDGRFAAERQAHPEFEGTSVIFLQNTYYEGEAIAYQDGLSTKFLTDLGFVVPSSLDPFASDVSGGQAYIPLEQLGVLDDADLLIWATESDGDVATLEDAGLYNTLNVVKEGRQVFTNGLLAGAIYFTSPLSLDYVLDELPPAAAAALAGDGPVSVAIPDL